MNPITINLLGKYTDGYVYLGRLFLVEMDGTVSSISMDKLIAKIRLGDATNILKTAFLRNDWLNNEQGTNFFQIPGQLKNFKAAWNKIVKSELVIDSKDITLDKHFCIPDAPVFDIRAYGLNLYIGNRSGLYESKFITKDDNFEQLRQPSKIFDARTTFISAKFGELMISSNSDGLFRGQVGLFDNSTKVDGNPIAQKSIRTGWASDDVLNYESQNDFVYYVNKVEKSEKRPRNQYSKNDESSEKREVKAFGIEKYSQNDIMPENLKNDQIKYSFNSSKYCFLLSTKNILYRSTFIRKIGDVHLSKQLVTESKFEKLLKISGKTKIISTAFVPSGTVIETLSSVILTSSALKPVVLHNCPIYGMKTLLSSRRFKNLILVFHDSGLSIHSLFPISLEDMD